MQNQKIRIRLKAFDYRLIDKSALEIVETAKRTGAVVDSCVFPTTNNPTVSKFSVVLNGFSINTDAGNFPVTTFTDVVPANGDGAAVSLKTDCGIPDIPNTLKLAHPTGS